MRTIIAGSRTVTNYGALTHALRYVDWEITEVVSGTANGADKLGEQYVYQRDLMCKKFPADWDRYGKRAGMMRNQKMAGYANALIALWDMKSAGPANMIGLAEEMGLKVVIMPCILGFQDEFRWLSNFAPCGIEMDGDRYPSVEHAYQAAKMPAGYHREQIKFRSAGAAKKYVQQPSVCRLLDPEWHSYKIDIMLDCLMQKYTDGIYYELLLATENYYIEETNAWKDTFWGVYNGRGKNVLGEMIMAIRDELAAMQSDVLQCSHC
jgi:ribA/ribD-fused uncharacterized protein